MTGNEKIRDRAKQLWLKSMEAVGNMAASIANNTKYKVDEVTIQNRRRVVMNDLAGKTYSLWLKGVRFPDQLDKMLNELQLLDDQLSEMRAAKYASSNKLSSETETVQESESEEDAEQDIQLPDINPVSPVTTEINVLFDEKDSVGHMAEKVNSTLDQMSERIRSFPMENEEDEPEKEQES